MRFNNAELSLVKGLFAGNEDLLYALRKVLLQFSISEKEEIMLKGAINDTTFALIKKFFSPNLDPESPLFQMTDMYLGLGSEIKALDPVNAWPFIRAKELEIAYINQQMDVLENVSEAKKPKIVLADLTKVTKVTEEDAWVNISARNFILSFVDSNVHQIKVLAGSQEETVEQTMERLKKNSNK